MSPHARSHFLLSSRKRLAQLLAVFFVCGAGAAHASCPAPVSGVITVSGSATTPCVLDGATTVGLIVEDSGSIETSDINHPSVDVTGSSYIENSGSIIHSRELGGNAILVRPGVPMSHLTNQAGGLIEGAPASGGSSGIGIFVDTTGQPGEEGRIGQLLNEADASILGTSRGIENNGTIDELINDGLIRGGDDGIGSSASGKIVTLRNRGSIEGDVGIYLISDIDDLINHGLIEGSGATDIRGEGYIAYLENAQAGLRLQAELPGSYAVLIDGESAGGLVYLGAGEEGPSPGGDECLQFGIAADSNVTQTNYPNVLSGVDPCSTTGTFQNRSWTLQPTLLLPVASGGEIVAQDSHTSWDLSFGDFIGGPTPIPSLSHLAMAVLAALMALVGLRNRRWGSF